MAFGLTPTGFNPKTLTDLKTEIEDDFKSSFGNSIAIAPESNNGQLIGIMSDRLAELWEAAEAVNSATNPDNAEGASLVGIAAITGTVPNPALASTVVMVLMGTPGTILNIGRVASVAVTGVKFQTISSGTILAASAWVAATAYGVNARVTNGGNIYHATVGGTSAGAGGPSGTGTAIVDNTVTWRFLGTGTGWADLQAQAQETGAKVAVTGTLTTIETPVSGWTSVNNAFDAVLGRDVETDAEFRIRREDELVGDGKTTTGAIRVALTKVNGVTTAIVFQNDGETTNVDGLPPHSVEALVQGGLNQDIFESLYENVAAGITYFGTTSGTVTDLANGGQIYTIKFTRPTTKNIYVIANVVKDPLNFPADGATQIRDAIVAYGATFPVGLDVISLALKARVFSIPGVLNVTTLFIGTAPAPATETTIVNTIRELALFDTARTTVNVSDGTP